MKNFAKNTLIPYGIRMLTYAVPVFGVFLLQMIFTDASLKNITTNTFIFLMAYATCRAIYLMFGDIIWIELQELFWFLAYHIVMAMLRNPLGKMFVVGIAKLCIRIKNILE